MFNKIKNTSLILLIIITIIFGYLLFKKKDPEVIQVPVKIEVPVPGKNGRIDTIYYPSPIKENPVNRELLKKYLDAKDSLAKLELYKEAVKERVYDTIFKDTTQSIEVYSKVQGKLLEQAVSYSIYPSTINVDTILDIPIKKKVQVFVGGELGFPLSKESTDSPIIQANLLIKNKNNNIVKFGFDTKGYFHVGYNIKL